MNGGRDVKVHYESERDCQSHIPPPYTFSAQYLGVRIAPPLFSETSMQTYYKIRKMSLFQRFLITVSRCRTKSSSNVQCS